MSASVQWAAALLLSLRAIALAQQVAIGSYYLPTVNSNPQGITAGPDGALWFAEIGTSKIGRITTSGIITEYPLPTLNASADGITTGPDGALWFTEGNANQIGRITTSGAVTEYPVPTQASGPSLITSGPDGALWS